MKLIIAVNVTGLLSTTGLGVELTVVLVLALLIVCSMLPGLLPVKFVSPL